MNMISTVTPRKVVPQELTAALVRQVKPSRITRASLHSFATPRTPRARVGMVTACHLISAVAPVPSRSSDSACRTRRPRTSFPLRHSAACVATFVLDVQALWRRRPPICQTVISGISRPSRPSRVSRLSQSSHKLHQVRAREEVVLRRRNKIFADFKKSSSCLRARGQKHKRSPTLCVTVFLKVKNSPTV